MRPAPWVRGARRLRVALAPILLANARQLRHHPLLAALTVLGIALGVAMSSGIDLAIASAHRAFADSIGSFGGAATDIIRGGPSGIPDAQVAAMRARLSPAPVAPRIECLVGAGARGGHAMRLVGIDPVAQGPFLGHGAPGALGAMAARLMTMPGAVMMTARTAVEISATAGADVELRIGTRHVAVRLVGLIAQDADGASALDDCAVCDISTAQELLGRIGRVDEVDVMLDAAGRERLRALSLPAGASLEASATRGAALLSLTSAFDTNLAAMGLLAMVVGLFLIYNTIDFLAVERAPDLARLRMHGAPRAAVSGAILLEAAILGACGSALGLALGIGCCRLLIDAISRTIGDLWFAVDVRAITLSPRLLAANSSQAPWPRSPPRSPPWRAPRLAPSVSLQAAQATAPRRVAAGHGGRGRGRARAGRAGAGVRRPGSGRGLRRHRAVPGRLCSADPARPGAGRGADGAAAGPPARSAGGDRRAQRRATLARTGLAVAALAVAAAASLGVDIMVTSFRAALTTWLDSTLQADVYVSAPRQVAARMDAVPLPTGLVERLSRVPGIDTVITKHDAHPDSAIGPIDLMAFDLPARGRAALTFVSAGPAPWTAFAAGDLLITEPFAARHHLAPGDALIIRTDRGEHAFRIAAVGRDYSSDQGAAMMSLAAYQRWWDDRGLSSFSAFASPGVSAQELVRRLRAASAGELLEIQSNADLRRASLEVFDRTFSITRAMRLLAGAVAFLGVLAALMAQGIERGRELALLRMHGATPSQVGALVGAQALLCGLAAGILALPLGVALAELLIRVVNRRSFGWSYDLHLGAGALALTLALALGAAVLAGLYPAWRAMRSSPARAMAGR